MKPVYYPERIQLLKFLGGKILDIGCNYGNFHAHVCERGDVYGLDIEVNNNYKEKMARGDATQLPFKNDSFDCVFAGEIIEHLTNPARLLREIERVLRTDGVAVVTTPNVHSLTYIRGTLLDGITLSDDSYLGHVCAWDLPLLVRFFERVVKLKVIECGFADPEETNKAAISVHRMKPNLSWFLYVVAKKN